MVVLLLVFIAFSIHRRRSIVCQWWERTRRCWALLRWRARNSSSSQRRRNVFLILYILYIVVVYNTYNMCLHFRLFTLLTVDRPRTIWSRRIRTELCSGIIGGLYWESWWQKNLHISHDALTSCATSCALTYKEKKRYFVSQSPWKRVLSLPLVIGYTL